MTLPLVTERLRLRPLTSDDVDDLLAYRGDPEVVRFVPFPPMDRAEVTRRIETQWNREADGVGNVCLGVELDGRVVGDVVVFWTTREHRSAEIGWIFHPDVAGRGYATEAAAALLGHTFAELGFRRVAARIVDGNDASVRVCERLGMRREAHLIENELFKGEWTSEIDYAILDREWRER